MAAPAQWLGTWDMTREAITVGFALMVMVLIAAIMSQRFRFDLRPGHPVELEATPTLRPHAVGPRTDAP
jgi:hypothetical protein